MDRSAAGVHVPRSNAARFGIVCTCGAHAWPTGLRFDLPSFSADDDGVHSGLSKRLICDGGNAMNRSMLRTVQAGVALLIVGAVTLALLVVIGVMERAAAFSAARDVGLLLVLLTGACCALIAVLGLGSNKDAS